MEHLIGAALPAIGPREVHIVGLREAIDFDERACGVFDLLAPHLAAVYRNAQAVGELETQLASLREGLEDMFTVRRLGINGRLAATLTNTNCIESMISIARDTTHNVKRWRDGKMIKRWCAAGMLNAERSFRRLKGHKQMPALIAALERHVEAVTPACDTEQVA